jgi:hypothetical protein
MYHLKHTPKSYEKIVVVNNCSISVVDKDSIKPVGPRPCRGSPLVCRRAQSGSGGRGNKHGWNARADSAEPVQAYHPGSTLLTGDERGRSPGRPRRLGHSRFAEVSPHFLAPTTPAPATLHLGSVCHLPRRRVGPQFKQQP